MDPSPGKKRRDSGFQKRPSADCYSLIPPLPPSLRVEKHFIIPPHSLSYEPRGGTHVQTSRRREFREPRGTQRFNQQTRRARSPALSSRGGGRRRKRSIPPRGVGGESILHHAG